MTSFLWYLGYGLVCLAIGMGLVILLFPDSKE